MTDDDIRARYRIITVVGWQVQTLHDDDWVTIGQFWSKQEAKDSLEHHVLSAKADELFRRMILRDIKKREAKP